MKIRDVKLVLVGVLIGAAITAGIFLVFGDTIRSEVSDQVETVGEKIQETGRDLR